MIKVSNGTHLYVDSWKGEANSSSSENDPIPILTICYAAEKQSWNISRQLVTVILLRIIAMKIYSINIWLHTPADQSKEIFFNIENFLLSQPHPILSSDLIQNHASRE